MVVPQVYSQSYYDTAFPGLEHRLPSFQQLPIAHQAELATRSAPQDRFDFDLMVNVD